MMAIQATNHLKNEIEMGVKVVLSPLATIKFPDHIRVANKANK